MWRRLLLLLPIYLSIYAVSFLLATGLRFDFEVPNWASDRLMVCLPIVLGVKTLVLIGTGEWQRRHRYTTLVDAIHSGACVGVSAVILLAIFWILPTGYRGPRATILIDAALSALAIAGLRTALRWYSGHLAQSGVLSRRQRTIIFGGERIAVALHRNMVSCTSDYCVVAFYDEAAPEHRQLIGGVPVFGGARSLVQIARELDVSRVLIPTSTPGRKLRQLLDTCQQAGLTAHVIPTVDEIVEARFKLSPREVTISDLLRREPNQLDLEEIRAWITGRTVLVTGAAGSIGSELCRQIHSLAPDVLILVDQSESGIFAIDQEFCEKPVEGVRIIPLIGDITDSDSMSLIFREQKPDLVFHAAAYKHVPLMEHNPREAIRNNVLGTKNLVDLADKFQVDRFVLISTDKAVRPTSLMGASKLAAEKYLQAMAGRSKTKFLTLRFGNVLNSVGSVVPTFRRQIEQGGPVTVTHPQMQRFFMTIPEAVQLVLQAGAIGESGDVLILDMGEPVKIVDLARDMIMLSGLRYPDDIDIIFTGMRPGEKLYEELFYETETGVERVHDKIFRGCSTRPPYALIMSQISQLKRSLDAPADEAHSLLMSMAQTWADEPEYAQQAFAA